MPPFSPVANGFLPNSRNEFWPAKPCQPSLVTQAGSTRPVEPPAVSPAGQSAFAQYRAPGTRRLAGTGISSAVRAIILAMLELPQGATPGWPQAGEPSAGPPAS